VVTVVYLGYRAVILPSGAIGASYSRSAGPLRGFLSAVYHTFKALPWEVSGRLLPVMILLCIVAFVAAPRDRAWRLVIFGIAWVFGGCLPLAYLGHVEPRLLYVPEVGVAVVLAGMTWVIVKAALKASGARQRTRIVVPAALLLLALMVTTTVSTKRSQDEFRPGSAKMLGAALAIWNDPPAIRARYPEERLIEIRQQLVDAQLIPSTTPLP
jgi:hypothetical protein